MNREYHKWYSPSLGRDMELLLYGHGGAPMLVFPTSMGRFFEYEDRGMIGAISGRFDQGHVQAFCPDSVDTESWYNKGAHPADRVRRHMAYEAYILNEVVAADSVAQRLAFDRFHGMQFRRIPCDERGTEASRHFRKLSAYEWRFRYPPVSERLLRSELLLQQPGGLPAQHKRQLAS